VLERESDCAANLVVDEPTTGVDAVSRREFWDLLAQLKASGLPIVVSTPYMDEANRCDRVALLHGGFGGVFVGLALRQYAKRAA
jgi:ABC-type multidrug transport system ATPase subunit